VPRFNEASALRADLKTRLEGYEIERRLGTLSANEIREMENRPSIGSDGDDYTPIGRSTPPAA
jgi:hypothetical protein